MYQRKMKEELIEAANTYPVIALLGPRQAGKTTLIQNSFPDTPYVLLEDLDKRDFALTDPKGFLEYYENGKGLIIDEAQYAPNLFSYIQGIVDKEKRAGQFILTGSQNFLLNQQISQSLAGRVRLLTLFPPSIGEVKNAKISLGTYEEEIWRGSYPRVLFENFEPLRWYQDYISTYLEKDVRQIKAVENLYIFQKFLALCAGRVGQILNWSELARDCGITLKTAQSWMSVLEASYLVFLLQPYHKNFSKRLVKSPKLYFYDTGVACSLLNIRSSSQIVNHYLKGALFESYIISDIKKRYYHRGIKAGLHFWRDKQGLEVDCLIDQGDKLIPIEIKSGSTLNSSFFSGILRWNKLAGLEPKDSYLIYGGQEEQKRNTGHVLGWKKIDQIDLGI
jgi:predicted AAA+ superfamily ATPase